jgi:nucleobase:cation symporter-1, NCS1 family
MADVAMGLAAEGNPQSDREWHIETHGIDVIPDQDRHGQARELFWIWCAANIGILGVTYGAFLIVFYSLNLWQGILAALLGAVLGFVLVGLVGLAGTKAGAPTMTVSRAAFGVNGNRLPSLVSYVSFIGWEIVVTTLAVLAAQTVLTRLGVPSGTGTTLVALVVVGAFSIVISLLGHATLLRIQTWVTWLFAALTVVFVVLEWGQVDWSKVNGLPSGSLAGFIGGISIIAAGLGIGYVNGGADYTRYLPKNTSRASIVGWTAFGASLPQVLLMIFGLLLAAGNADLATTSDPIGALAKPLPTWFLVPYMLVAVGGLSAASVINMYSSGLSLMALGLRLPRYKTVLVDAVLLFIGCVYMLFIATSFFGPLAGFLVTLGVPLSAWAAIFLVDLFMYRRDGYREPDFYRSDGIYGSVNVAGVGALVIATVVGLGLVTSATFPVLGYLLGPLGGATGPIGSSSIGIFIAFVIGAVLYPILVRVLSRGSAETVVQPSDA